MISSSHLVRFDLASVEPEDSAPLPERILKGDPKTRCWTVDQSADGKTFAGVWESTPGAWRIAYDEWEFCSISEGISILHEDGVEAPVVLRAGDHFVIRPGFTGIWEVVETTRKLFVIRLP